MNNINKLKIREITITRVLNAQIERVWEFWTLQKHIQQWWGPKGFTNPVCQWNAQEGNNILIHMQSPDGQIYPMGGVFGEINKPSKLIFTGGALDANGKKLFEQLTTVTFTKQDDKTNLVVKCNFSNVLPEAEIYLEGGNEGWKQSIDKLEDYLEKEKI